MFVNEYILQPSETEGEEREEPSRRRTRRVSAKVITPALCLHWFYTFSTFQYLFSQDTRISAQLHSTGACIHTNQSFWHNFRTTQLGCILFSSSGRVPGRPLWTPCWDSKGDPTRGNSCQTWLPWYKWGH